jgi:chromosome segregation protein
MRLIQLKIKGFKSFANDTVIHFNEDVIGIVGPNGSGKSNIVDAIRWVLGEQKSKELRLEQMQDVIFNGTKTKKEAPSATVELVFDNNKGVLPSEYSTVSIARTLYRSGESEYRLNDVVCRLKDIKSLFMDTGIGSNSYAIISLGMVDDLLYDKDDSRRYMFEQAAGVSKYKSRKKETLSKLNSTNQDLDRVSDLIFEIEGNMKSLEKQAKRTRKYFELKEEYKGIAIQNGVRSIQSLKDKYKLTGESINEKQVEYQKISAQLNLKEADLESNKKNNLEAELTVSQKQKELSDIIAEIRNLENDKNLLNQKINFKGQSLKNIENHLIENHTLVSALDNEILMIESRLNSEILTETSLKLRLEEAKEKLTAAREVQGSAKSEFELRTRKIQDFQKQLFDLDKELAITNNTVESQKSEISRLNQEIAILSDEREHLDLVYEESRSAFDLKSNEANALREREATRKENIIRLEQDRDKLTDELGKINRGLDAKQNEYDLLKSMIENFEGFPESLKFLASNWRKDVPVLSDLLDVKDDFKQVIEQYLEPYLNYFIVNDINEAAEAIELLKQTQKGKANFFLLNKIPNTETTNIDLPFTTRAIDCINIEERYKRLLAYLLKDTYIFDGAITDLKYENENEHCNFLSKSGSYLKSKVSISGGSVGLFEGKKIGRKKNLEKLLQSIEESNAKKSDISLALEKVKSEHLQLKSNDKSLELDLLNKDLNKIEQEMTRHKVSHENINQKINDAEARINKTKLGISTNEENLKELEIEKLGVKRELDGEEQSIKNSNSDLDSLTDTLNKASEGFNFSNIELIKQQSLISNFTKDLDFKKSRSNELKNRIQQETDQKDIDQSELHQSEQLRSETEEKLIAKYKQKEEFQSNLNETEQGYYQARNIITGLEEDIRVLNRGISQYQSDINTLKDTYQEMKFQINAVGDRIYIEFNVSLDEMMNVEIDAEINDEELATRVEQVKTRLHNYGEINPMAMEAYEEIKSRYDVMIIQRDDINKAKESLIETINEIESSATSQFMQAFEEIRSNFITVFRSLFTEDDNCDLILMQPDNPLESEIEIIAKPKGKKPKSLSQLSGGEKTLTATALLFALYLLKPAPFCIFDEVDAPLDDANIQKFNKIIQKFAERSQFIIVTHNKSTMAAVDTLYGVYMQEMGISGLTQVDFRNFKNDPYFEEVLQN